MNDKPARYIDANKLNTHPQYGNNSTRTMWRHIAQIVDEAPTEDVVPRSALDNVEYTLVGVMHSVDKWLDGDELKQDEVNRAATMREKTLQIIEGQQKEIVRLEEALRSSFPSYCKAFSEEETLKVGKEYGKREATKYLLGEIEKRLPTQREFHNHEIQMGYAWALSSVQNILNGLKAELLEDSQDE